MKIERKHRFYSILHHLLIAASLTSAVFLAKYMGMTKFLDGLTLSSLQWLAVHNYDQQDIGENGVGELKKPVLMTVSQADYVDHGAFDATSPLSREELAKGLRLLFESRPSHVFIDLDLAPSTSRYKEPDELDSLLDRASRNDKIQVVLITPISSKISSTAETWLRQRCRAGIELAFSFVEKQFGVVLDYRQQYPALGVVAREIIQGAEYTERGKVCNWFSLRESQPHRQDELKNKKSTSLHDQDDQMWREASREEGKYIRWTEWANVEPIEWHRLKSQSAATLSRIFKQRVVFVGSGYDPRDRFQSPIGEINGVQVHMAIAYSGLSEKHLPMYLIEIGLGTLLGTIGSWCFVKHRDYRNAHVTRAVHDQQAVWSYAPGLVLRGLLFITPALTGLFIFLLIMFTSASFLRNGVWLNPAPLAIGTFLHILMRCDEPDGEFESTGHSSGGKASSFLTHPSWWMIHGPLNLIALYLVFAEVFH